MDHQLLSTHLTTLLERNTQSLSLNGSLALASLTIAPSNELLAFSGFLIWRNSVEALFHEDIIAIRGPAPLHM